ncbi:D-alanyl-D-alanine carboxypeptidase [Litchfieldia salsa]|uniref:D-alanyl-D-alanine carboxypeptidase n=2 Tax=Litchfieldia salsa TaxID=930152 RepID=A0A1H0TDY7_9BACI|nr:M15 family metallopeptidase [Litchfieldia salsa]SDP52224.1 D-alanyl-D-alanine carboxypeptidase [Litchfieldia salsa]
MLKRITYALLLNITLIIILSGCNQFDLSQLIEQRTADETQIKNEQTKKVDEIGKNGQEDSNTGDVNDDFSENEWVLEEEYFNQVEISDGLSVILNPENILSLVNKEHTLPSVYIPPDLVKPNVPFSFGDLDVPKRYLRVEAGEALENLFMGAKKDSIQLFAVSGYRSYVTQEAIYQAQIRKTGEEELANQTVAIPGQSEHQTGLAIDVSSHSAQLRLVESFGETEEGRWVQEHAHEYGFIVRYPKGKEEITGYQYEPWHLRYVGVEIATQIFTNNLTLEEFFGKVKKL